MVDDGDMGWAVIYANLIPEGKEKLLWKLFTTVWKGKRREGTSEKGNSHSIDINTGLAQISCSLLSPRLPAPWPLCSSFISTIIITILFFTLSSVQFSCSVLSDSLQPHGLQHARLPCPSSTPRACSNSCTSSWWCHPTISSSVIPFSSYLQSF